MRKKHECERAHHNHRLGPNNLMHDNKWARVMLHGAIQRVWLAKKFFRP